MKTGKEYVADLIERLQEIQADEQLCEEVGQSLEAVDALCVVIGQIDMKWERDNPEEAEAQFGQMDLSPDNLKRVFGK